MSLTLDTKAFPAGGKIPAKFTRDGANVSPALSWAGAPPDTKSFALIVADPDAPGGTFYHWAVWGIPANLAGLPEGSGSRPVNELRFGLNDFGSIRYEGPEPPHGHGVHHYHFRLAALDVTSLKLPARPKVEDVWREAKKHALASTEIVGTYER